MRVFWILVILLVLLAVLICYSALVVASRADYKEREMWEPKPTIDISSENTNCVSIAVALLDDEELEIDDE